ncbi:cadherin-like protein 26 isoform X2 [Ictalurus punctatus]|uniref:Cadherin-like protein 26 isoform X2 n=1 Tax=Ictalurus punctatus TaxID=7998 RepID=A0A2D0SIZ5_ICTPU|nr:cadherin-like protein 26 isoform X2 [Ictalurus punctatus]
MWNTGTCSRRSFRMRKTTVLLFLLALWAESSHELRSHEETNTETSERVLTRSKRRWVLNTVELEEECTGPFPKKITEVHNDKHLNHSLKFRISGQGVTEKPKGVFTINENTGEIYTHKPIDRETYPIFHVNFDVVDRQTGEILDKTLALNLIIRDKNDNPPVFKPEILNIDIPENTKEGQLPVSLQARDIDEQDTDNSRISMRIVSQEPALPKISLASMADIKDSMITNLVFTGCFDYDKVKTYKMLVEACDHGTPSLSSTMTVNIAITDSNTHSPVFTAPKFNAQVMELETNKEILRIPVQDQDTPNTTASRAVFTILKGNEEGNYKIETDPVTNEGVLTVIKGKDYERTTLAELEIGVENEQPLFLCVDGKPVSPVPKTLKSNNTVKVTVKVIDVNDPPVFQNKIQKVYRVEEEEPGEVLYTPTVTDEDSDPAKLRYELVEDPAKWMSIDPQTGKISLVKKMDRESPYVQNSTYTVLMRAIDDGEPPATGTGTLVVHLGDKNDNTPYLISNTSVMCGNKADRVRVTAQDKDAFPFSGPFTFALDKIDPELKSLWKLEKSELGSEILLISQESLPYGNYSVPLKIADQQGMLAHTVLQVVICDCGKGDVCQDLLPRSSNLDRAAIGILLGALLLMALLLCCVFLCKCQEKNNFKQCLQEDSIQTLIKYNEEGGGSICKSTIGHYCDLMTERTQNTIAVPLHGLMRSPVQLTQILNGVNDATDSRNIYAKSATWSRNRIRTYNATRRGFTKSVNLLSVLNMEEHLERKLHKLSVEQQDFPEYHPHDYSSEGTNTSSVSLDKLSFQSIGDDLGFLQNLGSKFYTLDEIFQQRIKEKDMKL